MVILDGPNKACVGKSERRTLANDEIMDRHDRRGQGIHTGYQGQQAFDMHGELYKAIMEIVAFTEKSLMAALSHLVNNKDHGTSFPTMVEILMHVKCTHGLCPLS
jgi:hypothetical protein